MTIKFKRKYLFNPYDIAIKERFYSICNQIEPSLQKEKSILMVTSLAQTQKMTNATAYLALAFSEQRKRVLVVDANLRQPSLHHVFNIDHSFGLTTLLLKEQNKDTPIKISDYLSCLSTGEGLYEPVTLLTLETFPILIEEWKEHFDIILFHTSDFLNTPDAQFLTKYCDGVVLMIQEGRDKLEKITSVKKQLEHSKHEIIGAVIIS
ncbi:CpsD/CapB family tyrosine-protein kinase [Bacillus bingmayongensis]|uniref:CpsD/CapB family tyrosine-protein kinase n=1 Tax=Bacillus bingmayongensis TaxID=1150157 RepID=A0ABU5JRV2_9BACI|nr:CpsD/CapB family tyrosine-protein kinase [Bacillus bingmayongensis]MBY0595828.1 CpsD/CapB family tyrosine-protein kinase [Bacillus bingmayongensis]MDZ5606156.1 CpsD/CapB family tyrosine-protein kinase [Bacillus pseudomycoides]